MLTTCIYDDNWHPAIAIIDCKKNLNVNDNKKYLVGYDRNRIFQPEPEREFRVAGTRYGFLNSGSGMKDPELVYSNSGSGQKNRNEVTHNPVTTGFNRNLQEL